jgi:manganese/zinc/iron transport system substrate-binding protein
MDVALPALTIGLPSAKILISQKLPATAEFSMFSANQPVAVVGSLKPPMHLKAMPNSRVTRHFAIALFLAGSVATPGLIGCADRQPASASGNASTGKPLVVCTTGPVTDMLRQLGGEHLEVTGLMGPGVDPHLYKVLPDDMDRLTSADLIFYNGLHLEGRMIEALEELGQHRRVVAVTHQLEKSKDERLRKPPEFEGYYDPHVWHSPKIWADCVKYVAGILAEFDPGHGDDYRRNAEKYLKQLDEADKYCRERLALIPKDQRALVTAHDAFNYFCVEYDLISMPLKGVSTEDLVSLGRMQEVVDFLVARKVKAVFVESAVAPKLVEALVEPCAKAGHVVTIPRDKELYADALGSVESGADTYLGMIKANVDTIVEALK